MRRGPFLSALRLGLGLAAATAFGASAQGVVQPVCGPYEVTLYEFGSLYYRNGQGQRVGIDPEVLEEVARRTGCVFHTRLDSRVRTWALMAANRLDMTVSGVPTPERLLFARVRAVSQHAQSPDRAPGAGVAHCIAAGLRGRCIVARRGREILSS
jgi:hypothetical protein